MNCIKILCLNMINMKVISLGIIVALLLFSLMGWGQSTAPLILDSGKMYSMKDAYINYADQKQQYFLKSSTKPFRGFLYARYENGQLESVQQFKNGIGNGTWRDYVPDGKLSCEGTYVDNRVEGPVRFYYEDGSIKSKGQYLHWKKPIGLWIFYNRQGDIVSKRTFTR